MQAQIIIYEEMRDILKDAGYDITEIVQTTKEGERIKYSV